MLGLMIATAPICAAAGLCLERAINRRTEQALFSRPRWPGRKPVPAPPLNYEIDWEDQQ